MATLAPDLDLDELVALDLPVLCEIPPGADPDHDMLCDTEATHRLYHSCAKVTLLICRPWADRLRGLWPVGYCMNCKRTLSTCWTLDPL